jgi:diguanylate cyclase (GGDEF)-like protein
VSRQLAVLTEVGESGPGSGPRHERDGFSQRVAGYVERQPAWLVFAIGVILVGLVGWVDYLAGEGLSFTPFYLVPVALVTWVLGRGVGVAIALAATFSWSLAYLYAGPAVQWDSLTPYWNIAVQLGIFVVMSLILSGLREGLEHEKELARTDPVTGAPNSRAFFEQVEQELERSARYGHPFTVAYLDADDFKGINDRFGHTVGDNLLRVVAGVVGGNLRTTDLVARIAGDEFTLLMPETGRKEAEMVMSRVSTALAAAMESNGWPVTFSMGVVTYASPPPTVNALVKIADDVMYSVKRNGKNSVRHAVFGERKGAA